MSRQPTSNFNLNLSSAMSAIKVRREVRVFAETSALRLLGLEDRYTARLEWKARHLKSPTEEEVKTLANAKDELSRRSESEMEEARAEWARRNKIWSYFPDTGPLRRELYPRHMDFIAATKTDDEILCLAANRVGKTLLGAYCMTCWATGRYPRWWKGRVFDGPITGWICNKTAKDVRDINEQELLGPTGNEEERGTGMIPAHLILKCTPKPGTPHGFEFINVEHVSGGTSYLVSKSYDQGREAFQGRGLEAIWNDEEVTSEISDEERLRVMTRSGLLLYTYTPINGLTEMTMKFMESAGLSIDSLRHSNENLLEFEDA